MFKYFKIGDLLLIISMGLIAIILSIMLPKRLVSSGNMVLIETQNRLVGRYSLSQNRIVSLSGPIGETKVMIDNGKVAIISSPCPNHYCVNMGHLYAPGGALICVPNEIIVRVGDDGSQKLDAISR